MVISGINIKEGIGLGILHEDKWINELYDSIPLNNKVMLFEEYGFYDGILEDVEVIVSHILDMIKLNREEYSFKFNSRSLVGIDECNIRFKNIFYNGNASCSVIDGRILEIEVRISQAIRFGEEDNIRKWLEDKIESLLVHEMTHADNDYNYFGKYKKDNISPDWYYVVINNIKKYSSDSIVRNFLYSLYLSEYSEIQAFSNQVVYEIYKKLRDNEGFINSDNSHKKEMILGELKNNRIYTDYIVIKEYLLPMLKGAVIFQGEEIYRLFKENGIDMDDSMYNKYLKQIEFACNRAISKIKRGLNIVYKKFSLI